MIRLAAASALVALMQWAVPASAMEFSHGGVAVACRDPDACKAWINATGDITESTVSDLETYLQDNPYAPRVLRLNSRGGSLVGGLQLGLKLRELGFDTEAQLCASSCLYAFLGGKQRTVVSDEPLLGIHRFYNEEALSKPDAALYTGGDMDGTQQVVAGLLFYTVAMGVDPGLIALTGDAGPEEMRWLTIEEARELKVLFEPHRWEPWEIRGGEPGKQVYAASSTQDGTKSMQLLCIDGQLVFMLIDKAGNSGWFQQCATGTFTGYHRVLGRNVAIAETHARSYGAKGEGIAFALPPGSLNTTQPGVFQDMDVYSMACLDANGTYAGTTARLASMARLIQATCPR